MNKDSLTSRRKFVVSLDHAGRLDTFLSRVTGRSRVYTQEKIKRGHVDVNGKTVLKPSFTLKPEDVVHSRDDFEPAKTWDVISNLTLSPEFKLQVLHEDDDILVINKPRDIVVHPASSFKGITLSHYLLDYLKTPQFSSLNATRPGIVHRLDKGTSGVMVIAKHREALEKLSQQFKARTVKKQYETVVWGKLPLLSGRFDSPLGRHRKRRTLMSRFTSLPKPALTDWRKLEEFTLPQITPLQILSHVRVFPLTGRTHQIRVHFYEAGFPIVGDPLYGGLGERRLSLLRKYPHLKELSSLLAPGDALLHAFSLEFDHPQTKERLTVTAPLPKPFRDLLHLLTELKEAT